ncbi:MAG: S23 ribosomal protein [Candidatus Magasanikbacteria bacterium GW2011_GWC2_37_14]|uniref:S23 ribosomal protein n=1 Tax=Candidatus Magasanikbacteria bacterium GW2011_GWC2_37_14 TaxID=1619046 RepID=A0A0G0IS40_9BACT|nr:MAG: S23 ribosomal protein [Candidatus Magasanikbacteria bacterium GW2011_GWC2_37_14]
MVYRFENLETWKLARGFVNLIYSTTKLFPKEELFSLTNQIRRAALSIMLNITEGSDRQSDIEYIRFLRIAYTSLEEVIAGCYIAKDQNYLEINKFTEIYSRSELLGKKIHSLINYLKRQ